jgi:hypothetical protein
MACGCSFKFPFWSKKWKQWILGHFTGGYFLKSSRFFFSSCPTIFLPFLKVSCCPISWPIKMFSSAKVPTSVMDVVAHFHAKQRRGFAPFVKHWLGLEPTTLMMLLHWPSSE